MIALKSLDGITRPGPVYTPDASGKSAQRHIFPVSPATPQAERSPDQRRAAKQKRKAQRAARKRGRK